MKNWIEYIKENSSEDIKDIRLSDWISKVNDIKRYTYSLEDMSDVFDIRYQYFDFELSEVYGHWIEDLNLMPISSELESSGTATYSPKLSNSKKWYPGVLIGFRAFNDKPINGYDFDLISEYYKEISELRDRLSENFSKTLILNQVDVKTGRKSVDQHCYNIIVIDEINLVK